MGNAAAWAKSWAGAAWTSAAWVGAAWPGDTWGGRTWSGDAFVAASNESDACVANVAGSPGAWRDGGKAFGAAREEGTTSDLAKASRVAAAGTAPVGLAEPDWMLGPVGTMASVCASGGSAAPACALPVRAASRPIARTGASMLPEVTGAPTNGAAAARSGSGSGLAGGEAGDAATGAAVLSLAEATLASLAEVSRAWAWRVTAAGMAASCRPSGKAAVPAAAMPASGKAAFDMPWVSEFALFAGVTSEIETGLPAFVASRVPVLNFAVPVGVAGRRAPGIRSAAGAVTDATASPGGNVAVLEVVPGAGFVAGGGIMEDSLPADVSFRACWIAATPEPTSKGGFRAG